MIRRVKNERNDDAEHAQELPADFESKGLSGGDQSAEDRYGTGPAVACESELDREMEETGVSRSSGNLPSAS